jgi:uncharacterized protein (DUF488 family)
MALTNKQRALLTLVESLEQHSLNTKTAIMKALFLLKHDFRIDEKIRFYSFFPYKYGPYSEAVYSDLNYLASKGLLEGSQTALTEDGKMALSSKRVFREQSRLISLKYPDANSMRIDVYRRYPKYAVKSELIKHAPAKCKPAIFATGYESEDIDEFLNKLIQNNIGVVVDIRNNPFSMKYPFTKDRLIRHLARIGVKYVHFKELGVEKELRERLQTPEDYNALFLAYKEKLLQCESSISKVLELAHDSRIALLCFERNSEHCHRSILAAELRGRGKNVTFI